MLYSVVSSGRGVVHICIIVLCSIQDVDFLSESSPLHHEHPMGYKRDSFPAGTIICTPRAFTHPVTQRMVRYDGPPRQYELRTARSRFGPTLWTKRVGVSVIASIEYGPTGTVQYMIANLLHIAHRCDEPPQYQSYFYKMLKSLVANQYTVNLVLRGIGCFDLAYSYI